MKIQKNYRLYIRIDLIAFDFSVCYVFEKKNDFNSSEFLKKTDFVIHSLIELN